MMKISKPGFSNRSGQTIIFVIVALVMLVFVVLWNFDVHKILHVKSVAQNGGDSAALAAARWQGITLNLIGDLNIMSAIAVGAGDTNAAAAINEVQARLCYSGPMIGFMAAQQAAKNNGIYQNADYSALLAEHARAVLTDYGTAVDSSGQLLFPEPYTGCWFDYGHMLEEIAAKGVAVGPDNARYYTDYAGGHYLLMKDFYTAVAGQSWCWFFNSAPDLLPNYTDYNWWAPLPVVLGVDYMNSEIFSLSLAKRRTVLDPLVDNATFIATAADRGSTATNFPALTNDIVATWYCYDPSSWGAWDAMDISSSNALPITGNVKAKYNYAGADVAVRIEAEASRLTPGPNGSSVSNTITWSAAAKPFGYLGDKPPCAYPLVLPSFHDIALIPVDAASGSGGGGYDISWRRHIQSHLPAYLSTGVTQPSCWYCQQLVTWENPAFRAQGTLWLSHNSALCIRPTGGPGGPSPGGTRRGH